MSCASALVLQTQDNSPPGLLVDWACSRGLALDVLRVDRWDVLPDPTGYECAIALGSDVSIAERRPDWVGRELHWLQWADAVGVPVLGICFGAQALAIALGGSVNRLASPEFAWVQLQTSHPQRVPQGPWLAMHEDAITPPPQADELAWSACGAQAFSVGTHLGVLFHPEATPTLVSRWIADRRDRLAGLGGRLLATAGEQRYSSAAVAFELFDGFAAHAGLQLNGAARAAMT
jgi:GMP synthase-like glutamine amidotransferase